MLFKNSRFVWYKIYGPSGKALDQDDGPAQLAQQIVSNAKNEDKKIVAASDMDLTMVDKDLGVLFFIKLLHKPSFWKHSLDGFKNLLLPEEYEKALHEGASEKHKILGLEPQRSYCRFALDLKNDIVAMYEEYKRGDKEEIIAEFAHKMLLFDEVMMKLDSSLKIIFNGQLLMRTRFLVGQHPRMIKSIMADVDLDQWLEDDARYLKLPIEAKYSDKKLEKESLSHSPFYQIDQVAHEITAVHDLLEELVTNHNVPTVVATANLLGIADKYLQLSDSYRFIQEQRRKDRKVPPIKATKLKKHQNGELSYHLDGLPVHGLQKREAVEEWMREYGANRVVAFGDSLRTDGDMLRLALETGGTAFIVGETRKKIHEQFGAFISSQSKEDRRRIYQVAA